MRWGAEKEAAARRARGLVGPGPYETAYLAACQVLAGCALIVEKTDTLESASRKPWRTLNRYWTPARAGDDA